MGWWKPRISVGEQTAPGSLAAIDTVRVLVRLLRLGEGLGAMRNVAALPPPPRPSYS
jgi:hypothetical protein